MKHEMNPFRMPRLSAIITGETLRKYDMDVDIVLHPKDVEGKEIVDFTFPDPRLYAPDAQAQYLGESYLASFHNEIDMDRLEYIFIATYDQRPQDLEIDMQVSTQAYRERYTGSQERVEKKIFAEPTREYTVSDNRQLRRN